LQKEPIQYYLIILLAPFNGQAEGKQRLLQLIPQAGKTEKTEKKNIFDDRLEEASILNEEAEAIAREETCNIDVLITSSPADNPLADESCKW